MFAEGVALLTAVEAATADHVAEGGNMIPPPPVLEEPVAALVVPAREPRRMPPAAPESVVSRLKRHAPMCTTHHTACDCINLRVIKALLLARAVTVGFSGPMVLDALRPQIEEALAAMLVPEDEWDE